MENREEARRLLDVARKDLKALPGMTDVEIFADELFGFHARQATEKTLKPRLTFLDREFPKNHDITLLFSRLKNCGADINAFKDLDELNPFAVQFRYDVFDDSEDSLDRSDMAARVQLLFEHVEKLINKEATTESR